MWKSTKYARLPTDHNPEDKSKCPKISEVTTHKNLQLKKKLSLSYAEAVKNYVQNSNEFNILSCDGEDLVEASETQSHDQPTVKIRKTATIPLVKKPIVSKQNKWKYSQSTGNERVAGLQVGNYVYFCCYIK